MQAITTASVLALPLDMEEVTESSDSDEVGSLSAFSINLRPLPPVRSRFGLGGLEAMVRKVRKRVRKIELFLVDKSMLQLIEMRLLDLASL